MTQNLLTATEVAERLSVTRQTVARWADTGPIKVVVLPSGRRRFLASEIDELLASTDSN